jgi:L-rhamnono-1,4-lactonase
MKPDFTTSRQDQPQAFQDWASVVQKLASFPRTYVKLSGAFSEMPENQVDSWDTRHMASTILPWFEVVLDAFGPARILFGSDWPVCSEHVDESWRRWREVVEDLCYLTNLDNEAIASIFAGTAREAYRL